MALIEITLIGAGLAMDAVAVSMTNTMAYRHLKIRNYIAMPLLFGLFQAFMPIAGYFAGSLFAEIISRYAGIVILLILGVIGGKMMKGGLSHLEGQGEVADAGRLTIGILIFQAVATSIDAFAVGVGLSAIQADIGEAAAIIAVVTAIMVTAAMAVGRKFGSLLGSHAEILGGAILVIIGIKAIL